MIKVKKSESTSLKGKALSIINNKFADYETGEIIDLIEILKNTFGDLPFDLTAIQKVDTEEDG